MLSDLQAQEFIGEVAGARLRWTAWATSSPDHYLFVCADNPGFRVVVSKAELQAEVQGHAA